MRAAEILAEMVLNEAALYGIIYGPDIPKDGYWVTGQDMRDMVARMAQGLGSGARQQVSSYLDALIGSGYSLVVAEKGKSGQVAATVYGLEIPDLSDRAVKILGLTAQTPVTQVRQYGKDVVQSNAGDAFGIKLTPQERINMRQQKAQERERLKNPYAPSPEDEAKFRRELRQKEQSNPYGGTLVSAPRIAEP